MGRLGGQHDQSASDYHHPRPRPRDGHAVDDAAPSVLGRAAETENPSPAGPERGFLYPIGAPGRRQSQRAYAGWNTKVRNSMLSRTGAPGGVVGSANEVCGMKRAGMSVRAAAIFRTTASS